MSTFDIHTDSPGLLRAESLNITLKFDRTGPTTGRVSWNIPSPAAGCTAGDQAYCGMLVTIDTVAIAAGKSPSNGTVYNSDPTANANLFAGDKIGTAFVVGAFYQDRDTTFFDVTELKPNTPYYVSGFPVDCQIRYFPSGVHAYSLDYTNKGTDGTNGSQVIVLNSTSSVMGSKETDATGLDRSSPYTIKLQVGLTPTPNRPLDSVECKLEAPTYPITVDGSDAQTYGELVTALNEQIALLSNGARGPTPPNTGSYYWNNDKKKLFTWNGTSHIDTPVILSDTDPSIEQIGSHWLDTLTGLLYVREVGAWTLVPVITLATDPTVPVAEMSYWYDGNMAWLWNGNAWCETAITTLSTDPSSEVQPMDGAHWYDTLEMALYKWNNALEMWKSTTAVQSITDPMLYTQSNYWLNETTNTLYQRDFPVAGWNASTNVAISETAPSTPAPGKLWYNPSTQELYQRDVGNTTWVQFEVTSYPTDPTVRLSCDLWWNTATDVLHSWDVLSSTWIPVTQLYQQPTDPTLPPTMQEGEMWFNPTTGELSVWENACFKPVTFVNSPTNPMLVPAGAVWYNSTNNLWYIRAAGAWSALTPISSATDPLTILTGTLWFSMTTQGLNAWNGISWVSITYSPVMLTPTKGTLWYNTTLKILYEWNGFDWAISNPIVTVDLDCNGNILFVDTTVGSTSFINITDVNLVSSLSTNAVLHDPSPGTDGVSSEPSYTEIGVGTDGSDDIRKSLITEMRYELGYPVVDVELTKEQMDYALTVALQTLRQRSGLAYKRGFFFMAIPANQQRFYLSNKISGMNKIVDVMGVYRMTSAFLASAHGAGVYGQIVMQHLYNMGTFDLLSYHIMAEYTKLMEMLFAARLTFTWNEQTRELMIMNRFAMNERMVCIEATEERTEQDIMSDRYARPWIRRYAAATCRIMLAETRGKFSTLPGAGGGITLNAAELRQAGNAEIEACLQDIDSYIIDKPEEYGMGAHFTFG